MKIKKLKDGYKPYITEDGKRLACLRWTQWNRSQNLTMIMFPAS